MTDHQREEAIVRMDQLIQAFDLDPRLADELRQGRVCRSFDDWGSNAPITEEDFCWESCQLFEEKTGAYVYHVLDEYSTDRDVYAPFGLLYVSQNPADWPKERLQGKTIQLCRYWYREDTYTLEEIPLYADHGALFLQAPNCRRLHFENRNVTVQLAESDDDDADIVSEDPVRLQHLAGEVIEFLEGWGMFRDAKLLIPGHLFSWHYPLWKPAPRHAARNQDPSQWEEIRDLADPAIHLETCRPYYDESHRRTSFEDLDGLWLEIEKLRRAGRNPRPVLALYTNGDLREIVGNDDLDYHGDYEDDYESPYVDARLDWSLLSRQNQWLLLQEAWNYQGLPNSISYRPDDLWSYLDGDTWEHYDPHRCSYDDAPNSTLDPLEFDSYDEYLDLEDPVLSADPKNMQQDLEDAMSDVMRLGDDSDVFGYNTLLKDRFFQLFADHGLSYIIKGGRLLFFYLDPEPAPDKSPSPSHPA